MPKKRYVCFVLILVLASCMPLTSAQAQSPQIIFPASEKSIFFLDTSGSNDAVKLWKNLRDSIVKKLPKAMGYPKTRGIRKPLSAFDISIGIINGASDAENLIPIVQQSDANGIWGVIITSIGGGKPTPLRLEKIIKDFFGPVGAYDKLEEKYLSVSPPIVNQKMCESDAKAIWMSNRGFMANGDEEQRVFSAKSLCSTLVKIGSGLTNVDKLFKNLNCAAPCSDVIGAMSIAHQAAEETYSMNQQSKMCIAIASDMVNNTQGVKSDSPFNTKRVIETSSSALLATQQGQEAARMAAINFPAKMKIRIALIGQGAGSGIPADKKFLLTAYWDGFWSASGIKGAQKVSSINEACN